MKFPPIRRIAGGTPPAGKGGSGKSSIIRCPLQPPAYRLSANDAARLLADPRVRAPGWNRAKLTAVIGNMAIPALHAKFAVFVPGIKLTYSVTNAESSELVIARIKEGEWIRFELTLLNGRDAETSARFFQSHLLGAMSRYLAIQNERYLEDIDAESEAEILKALYAKLIEGLRESFETLSRERLCVHEAAEAAHLVHQEVLEKTNIIIENWFIRYFSSSVAIPEVFFGEGVTSVAASLDRTLENTLSTLKEGGIVFLPQRVVESAAYAAALHYLGFPRLSSDLRGWVERALRAYLPAFLLKAFPKLAATPLALPTQQQRFLNQALLTFDEVKKFYLLFAPKIMLKPAFRG